MRFALTHKVTSYLMALAAVASLLLSPELSSTAVLASLAAIAASWFVEPSRGRVPALESVWNALTVLFLLSLVYSVFRGTSAIHAGVYFLLFVLVNKLFNRRSAADYQQAYTVSFLMIVAATTLNTGLSYAACFIAYVVFGVWSLMLLHLRGEMEGNDLLYRGESTAQRRQRTAGLLASRRIVDRRFLLGSGLASLCVFAGAALFFAFFPRVGFGLFAGAGRHGITMSGFRDRVELGHHGTVRNNPEIVMRVRFGAADGPAAPPPGPLRWRGSVFDHYEGGIWSHSSDIQGTLLGVQARDGLYVLRLPVRGVPWNASPRVLRDTLLRQEIYLEPIESRVVFAADIPVAVELPSQTPGLRPMFIPRKGPLGEIRGARMRTSGVRYIAYSKVDEPEPAALRRDRPVSSHEWFDRYLELPADLSPRVRALAARLTRGTGNYYDKAIAIQRYLRQNYRYTLELTHRPGIDPVDEFLFETRQGHCEYFASAMALLLRSAGVPTRNVNGFLGGQWNAFGKYLAVRQGDAHSWIEVLFPNHDWVAFDPTPPAGQPSGGAAAGILQSLREIGDALRLRWFAYVVEYDLAQQISLFRRLRHLVADPFTGRSSPTRDLLGRREGARTAESKGGSGAIAWVAAALALAGLLASRRYWLALWRQRGQRRDGRGLHAATVAYRRALSLLERDRQAKAPSLTPAEFAAQLQQRGHRCAQLVDTITRTYYGCRFSGQAASEPRQREPGQRELEYLVSQLRLQLRRQQVTREKKA